MKLTTTEYALLGMLSMEPMSGYQLKQFAERTIGHFWSESFGQIYPALARLARAGNIRELAAKADPRGAKAQGRESRVYELTAKGRKLLGGWLPLAAKPQVLRNELLLKLFFGAEAPVAASRQRLQQQAEKAQTRLAGFADIACKLQRLRGSPPPDGPRVVWWEMTLRRGILDSQAELRWCQESLRQLETLGATNDPGNERRKSGTGKDAKQRRGRVNGMSAAGKKAKR